MVSAGTAAGVGTSYGSRVPGGQDTAPPPPPPPNTVPRDETDSGQSKVAAGSSIDVKMLAGLALAVYGAVHATWWLSIAGGVLAFGSIKSGAAADSGASRGSIGVAKNLVSGRQSLTIPGMGGSPRLIL